MDRSNQDTFLLSDLSELGSVEAGDNDVVPQQADEVQTVYAHLPSVLDESGYRQIYVTVDNPQDIASLARSFNAQQVGLNQSNIVTVTVPASQLVQESGTLILQPSGIAVSTDVATEHVQIKAKEHEQIIFSEAGAATGDKSTALSVLTDKVYQHIVATTELTEHKDIDHLHKAPEHLDSITEASSKDFAELIAETETPQSDNSTPIPLVICRCDSRKDNVKTAQQIFTNVQANLASQLMEKIPGCSATFLHQFTMQHDMTLQRQTDVDDDNLQVSGELHKLLCLHDNLSHLISAAECQPVQTKHSPHAITKRSAGVSSAGQSKDKAVHCDLIQPQYSRSGRQIKRRNLDHPMDKEDAVSVTSQSSYTPSATGATTPKKKRGRPPKKSKLKEQVSTVTDLPIEEKKEDITQSDFSIAESLSDVIASQAQVCTDMTRTDTNIVPSVSIVSSIDDCVAQLPADIIVEHVTSQEELVKESAINDVDKEQLDGNFSEDDVPDSNSLSEKENSQGIDTLDTAEPAVSKEGDGFTMMKVRAIPAGMVLGRKRHKKDYESLAPFKFHCSMCSFKSKRKSHYLKHLQIHTKKSLPVLQCAQCNFTTIRLSHLRRHQLSHSANIYTCKVCSYKTDDVKRLNRHHRIKHISVQQEPEISVVYQCDQCEYKTLKSHQYARHLRCHSTLCPDTAGQTCSSYQCPLCPYKTQRKEHYSRHVANVHTDRRPYLCDLCGKAFKRPDALRQHKLIHQDKHSRPFRYSCQDCLKGFRSHAHLVEHRTIHTDERSYLCEICGAAFKTRSVQRKHVQTIHQNPRAHSCSACDKRFNTKYALQRHLRTHNTPGMRLALEQLGAGTTVTVLPATTDTAHIIQELRETTVEEQNAMVTETIVSGDGTVTTVETQYEETADGTVRQLPQTAYIQTTSEETTALLYLTSLPTY